MEIEKGEFIVRKEQIKEALNRCNTGLENADEVTVEFDAYLDEAYRMISYASHNNGNGLAGVFRLASFASYKEGGCIRPCEEIGDNISTFADLNTRLNLLMISFDHRILMCAKWFIDLFRIK